MPKILLETSPLQNENAHRGVGVYTRFLQSELRKISDIELVSDHPDIIHYPFFDFFFATLPLKKKAATVVTIHDVIPLVFPKQYKAGKRGTFNLLRQKIALRSTKAIITDSNASKADIIKYLAVPESKVHVVALAPNPNLRPVAKHEIDQLTAVFQLPKKYILYVGDINYNKNLPQLIKSLKFLHEDIHLVCVGKNFFAHPIPEWEAIEVQLALSDVSSRVHFLTKLGADSDQILSAIYSGAICYVQPSLYEGFGLPVVEAFTCETPVVSCKNSSLVEVGGEVSQYVEPNAESIAEGVKKILQLTADERKELIKKGRSWVDQFSWTRTAHETAIIYRQIAQGNSES